MSEHEKGPSEGARHQTGIMWKPPVRPQVPDTLGLRMIREWPVSEIGVEKQEARRFLQAAETYLAWLQLSEQLAAQIAAIDNASGPLIPG